MIKSKTFLDICKKNGFKLFTGTPCSYLKPFINTVIDDPELKFIAAPNEGDAVALATGATLGGESSVVMFQNSGLGNAVNALTSLNYILKVPVLGITTLRGEPGGPKDEPQHELMGAITTSMLEMMKIPWSYFPTEENEVEKSLEMAFKSMKDSGLPYFFVMRKDSVDKYELKKIENNQKISKYNTDVKSSVFGKSEMIRTDVLNILKKSFSNKDAFIATTGKTGRELFEVGDTDNQIYMVGSMGCALPLGLGLTLSNFTNKVVVIDGDGALLMRMGNMALAGVMAPENLVHILIDNGVHDSTGGQQSFSHKTDFCQIAAAVGYKKVYEIDNSDGLASALHEATRSSDLTFIRVYIKPGSPAELGRPTVKPHEVAKRFKDFVKSNI